MLRANTCRIDISPDAPGVKTHGRMEVKALVIKGKNTAFAMAALDAILISGADADIIRKEINRATGIPFENITISASHTHNHRIDKSNYRKRNRKYPEHVERIIKCIKTAANNLKEVKVFSALGKVEDVSMPARFRLKDGSEHCLKVKSPLFRKDELLEEGPCDRFLLLLRLSKPNGKVLAHIVNFSCHASSWMLPDPKTGEVPFSGDFTAFAMREIEKKLGGCALFLNGPSADVYPAEYMMKHNVKHAEDLGRLFAKRIIQLTKRLKREKSPRINAAYKKVTLPAGNHCTQKTLNLLLSEREALSERLCLIANSLALNFEQFFPLYKKYLKGDRSEKYRIHEYLDWLRTMENICSINVDIEIARWKIKKNKKFERFERKKPKDIAFMQTPPKEKVQMGIHSLRIGKTAFVFLSGELFTQIALNIKKDSPLRKTGVVSLTNDIYPGYVPTDFAIKHGGYQGGYQVLIARTGKGTENVLRREAVKLLKFIT
jgi:hypothetical protein